MTSISAIFEKVRERELDVSFLPADLLNVQARKRTSAFPWRGQFTPGLPELLINAYDMKIGSIFDPFVGSGTTLLESLRQGRASVGVEVNPAAFLLARILELAFVKADDRSALLKKGREALDPILAGRVRGGLFEVGRDSDSDLAGELIRLARHSSPHLAAAFECALLLSMGDRTETVSTKILKSWGLIEGLVGDMLPETVSCSVVLGDARCTDVETNSVGLTLTSPPYINVFNYHQNYRPAVELLGWKVLPVARSEIGSNRKHRMNRFLTVIQYTEDMLSALNEIVRVSKHGANVVVVIGRESKVRRVPFANGEMLAVLAELLGTLKFVRWQERKFMSRFGVTIYEEILAFEVNKVNKERNLVELEDLAARGREVGVFCLDDAVSRAPRDVAEEIKAAIAAADTVRPSPLAVDRALVGIDVG